MQRPELLELCVVGQSCPIVDDPEKAVEVNEGRSLVSWCGNRSLLIDRYDCRAYLQDLSDYDHVISLDEGDYLSEEEVAIEKMCEFERYLELQTDIDDLTTQAEEQKKRQSEASRCKYGAVDFAYDEHSDQCHPSEVENGSVQRDSAPQTDEPVNDPYVCPPELKSLEGIALPDTDKQAQIIERTAVFVSRQGSQMEIVLKAKQTSNPLFGFLNYDHDLNPFYKELVKLIRQGRYIPKLRPSKTELPTNDAPLEPNKSIQDDHYELKLPKVDISTTAYASLINKFRKVNELASQAQAAMASPSSVSAKENSPELHTTEATNVTVEPELDTSVTSKSSPSRDIDSCQSSGAVPQSSSDVNSSNSPKPQELSVGAELSTEEYEQCYQEYYKHYYSHYYTQFSDQQAKLSVLTCKSLSDDERNNIVQQAAKAAAVAASAAVNAMYQARVAQKSAQTNHSLTVTMTPGERGIIDKMAEYVARNGLEFEELVTRQKGDDARFAFLKPNHPHNSYYLTRRRQLLPDLPEPNTDEQPSSPCSPVASGSDRQIEEPIVPEANMSTSPSETLNDRQSSISFKLTRPGSSAKLHSNGTSDITLPSVYVHSSIPSQHGSASSYPDLSKNDHSLVRPSTPTNSPVSEDNASSSHRNRSQSPVKFSLPGIPSGSSSSNSSPVSSRSASPSDASPVRNKSPVTKLELPKEKSQTKPLRRTVQRERKRSEEAEINPLLYPRTDIPCPPSPERLPEVKHQNKSSPRTSPLKSIEHILDDFEITHSPDRKASRTEERLRQERRKRAAQLVAKLRTSASSNTHNTVRPDYPDSRSSYSIGSARHSSSPPPAPDSVPAAVAHAVVASLKRRHEQSLSSLEAEAKARKRQRSPPSAYALPKERSHKSSSSRDSSSRHSRSPPLRGRDDSPDRRRSKHKKHKSHR